MILVLVLVVFLVLGMRGTAPGLGTIHIESANILHFDQAQNRTNTIGPFEDEAENDSDPLPSSVRIYRQKFLMMTNDELGDRIPGDVRDIRIKVLGHTLSMHREPFL
jgi:hypothetical protein